MFETRGVADKCKVPGRSVVVRLYCHIVTRDWQGAYMPRGTIPFIPDTQAGKRVVLCYHLSICCLDNTPSHPPSQTKAMETGPRPSLIAPLIALTAQLDGLRADQSPEDLSAALKIAFEKRDLYELYVSSLVEDEKRTRALLEVFDKVRSGSMCRSVRRFSILSCDIGTYSRGT